MQGNIREVLVPRASDRQKLAAGMRVPNEIQTKIQTHSILLEQLQQGFMILLHKADEQRKAWSTVQMVQ